MSEMLGGAKLHALQLASRLQARGHRCNIFSSSKLYSDLVESGWLKILNLNVKVVNGYEEFAQKLDVLRPDLIQHFNSLTAVAALELAVHRPVSVQVLHANHSLEEDYRHIYTDYTDHLIAVSDSVRRFYPQRQNCPPISIIMNGVDVEQFQPSVQTNQSDESVVRFLTIGRQNDPNKRLRNINSLFSTLGQKNWHLDIVGPGYDGGLEVCSSNESSNVEVHGLSSDMYSFFKKAEVYICGSITEGFGIAIAEAASSGLAIVTMACHGITEVLTHRSNAIICQSWKDFESAIKEVGNSRELRAELGRNMKSLLSGKAELRAHGQ